MSISGLLLGLINVAIVVVLLLLVGVIVKFVFDRWIVAIPGNMVQLYVALVALIALYMIVALFFGLPSWRVIGGNFRAEAIAGAAIAALPAGTASYLHRLLG